MRSQGTGGSSNPDCDNDSSHTSVTDAMFVSIPQISSVRNQSSNLYIDGIFVCFVFKTGPLYVALAFLELTI